MTKKEPNASIDSHRPKGKRAVDTPPDRAFTLEGLLKGVKREQIHAEVDTGPPVGREEW